MVTHRRRAHFGDVGCLTSVLYSRLLLRLGLFLVDAENPSRFSPRIWWYFSVCLLIRYLRAKHFE